MRMLCARLDAITGAKVTIVNKNKEFLVLFLRVCSHFEKKTG